MGYELNDENGFIASGPSISGLRDMKHFFSSYETENPALREFFKEGCTTRTSTLAAECKGLALIATDEDIRESLKELGKSAKKAKGIVILTL
jgi:hypothetical protein